MTRPDPQTLLTEVFGYPAFRDPQRAIIDQVISGGDALVVMPTGSGKSLCYQIPALCRDGFGVVVSPLIALMTDQVSALRQCGVRAEALTSLMDADDIARIERRMRAGDLDLLYVAPERITTERFTGLLSRCRVALFAIDEAHCVSQWGHDFRPEYMALERLADDFPDVPRIAVTATADAVTRDEIIARLRLGQGRAFIAGFDRPNIQYRIVDKEDSRRQLLAFLKTQPRDASGIVYALSRNRVETVAAWLKAEGYNAWPYHAGLERETRLANQARFLADESVVMVATIAFGMGINKPDVRYVAHLDLPKSIEAYYQETGRAGRDGLPAVAWMLYGAGDAVRIRQFIENSAAPDLQKRVERAKLDALVAMCEAASCRRQILLRYFGDDMQEPCGNCDACLSPIATFDAIIPAQKLLSAIYRTGQRYGGAHIVDVLRGRTTDKVVNAGHDQLPVFGVGSETKATEWRSILRQLTALGHVWVDHAGHGALKLGDTARAIFRGETTVNLRRPRRNTAPAASAVSAADLPPEAESLFEHLRAVRRDLAKLHGVPAYVIFHDTTLHAMAREAPRTHAALASMPGVGRSKLERFGDAFLAAIEAHEAQPPEQRARH